MLKIYSLSLFLLVWFSALHAQVKTITVNGVTRSYILYVPPGHNAGVPSALVLNFHGYGSNAAQEEAYTGMNNVADTAGFIVVYPEGINNSWNSFTPLVTIPDDVAFTAAIIDDVNRTYSVDSTRVYACGMSNGGFMSHVLACELANRIAAIASVTGLLSPGYMPSCNPSRPMPILQIHGTNDATVPYNGGFNIGSVDSTMQYWYTKSNCPTVSTTIDTLPNVSTTDNSYPIVYRTLNCDAGTEVTLIKIVGGGHTWPNAVLSLPGVTTNRDIDGSEEVWRFFAKYSHPNPAPLNTVTVPTSVDVIGSGTKLVNTYPNPIGDVLNIDIVNAAVQYIALYDVLGAKIQESHITEGTTNIRFATSSLLSGVYFLQVAMPTGTTTYKLVK